MNKERNQHRKKKISIYQSFLEKCPKREKTFCGFMYVRALWVCMYICIFTIFVPGPPESQKKVVRAPGTGVMDGCEPPCGC